MKNQEYPGTLIVIEGADGAGTTTQSKKLTEKLDAFYTAEPSENSVGEKVDEMISTGEYSAEAITLVFAADRILHLEEEVIPKLKKGETVVMDRYYHSSLVYQPALGADYSWVLEANRAAVKPDLTVVLDVSSEIALSRVEKRERDISEEAIEKSSSDRARLANLDGGSDDNIFENLSFQEEVVSRYRKLPGRLDENICVVDSSNSIEQVFSDVLEKAKSELVMVEKD